MKNIGIGMVEGFFGPEWSWDDRNSVCQFLSDQNADFYIYAPKRDHFLRRSWTEDHPQQTWNQLKNLSAQCEAKKIKFGVGLSPFEIHMNWNQEAKDLMKRKILKLQELGIVYLGLFFDDMKGSPDLAEKQIEIVQYVQSITNLTILFCPTYYSFDPILDKVFGQRPERYLEKIGEGISKDVLILWTGDKVISKAISADDLHSVTELLKRKPLVWDNYFANDGPKQCKFLKLLPLQGRDSKAYQASAGWAFNLMNQAHLSMIAFQSSCGVLLNDYSPELSFQKAIQKLTNEDMAKNILNNQSVFTQANLDLIPQSTKDNLQTWLERSNPATNEILDWLAGKYNVGPECLTD